MISPLDVTVACTANQLQCWLFPFVVYVAFIIFLLMIAAIGKATSKGATFLLVYSFVLASFVQVMLGLMPITVPMLAMVLLAVYAWRVN